LFKLPEGEEVLDTFLAACEALRIEHPLEKVRKMVIYEMTDGMRTSTDLEGSEAYVDGGIFSLRLFHILRILGSPACYINVIEERHRLRENYPQIYDALKRLYVIYDDYAAKFNVRLRFLGDLDSSIEPEGVSGHFAQDLKKLEEKTKNNSTFTAHFLINYSLDWAVKNEALFQLLPDVNVTVRHTKLQCPTGMMLPPSKSDYSSFVYVQQGSSSRTWTDPQLIYLVALALRSMMLNEATQYLKKYSSGERALVRSKREAEMYFVHEKLGSLSFRVFTPEGKITAPPPTPHILRKRVIIAGIFGPEIYEF
jgi:hypothetical protein